MKKTLMTFLVGAALFAPAWAQNPVAGNPRTEPVDVTATDKVKTQSGTGLVPRDSTGQSKAGFSMPNRNFRVGSPTAPGAQDVTQFPTPPAALPVSAPLDSTVQPPTEAPPAIDIKNAGDTTLDSRPSRDMTNRPAPTPVLQAPSTTGPGTSPAVNSEGVSANPSTSSYSTKAARPDANSTLLPSPTGPRNNARSNSQAPSSVRFGEGTPTRQSDNGTLNNK